MTYHIDGQILLDRAYLLSKCGLLYVQNIRPYNTYSTILLREICILRICDVHILHINFVALGYLQWQNCITVSCKKCIHMCGILSVKNMLVQFPECS